MFLNRRLPLTACDHLPPIFAISSKCLTAFEPERAISTYTFGFFANNLYISATLGPASSNLARVFGLAKIPLKNLLNLIKEVKGEYSICTSPLADDPNSEKHKRTWVEKNLAFFPPKEIIITHNKAKFATQADGTPNILIDDFGKNVDAWEAAGGTGFKYKDHKFERTAKDLQQHLNAKVHDNMAENFADGKVKGKSKPGRVKKSGASCNGSVTELRAKAKKASGERAKMYHWCANMKSGKKK